MAQRGFVVVAIPGKEGWKMKAVKQRNHIIFVLHSASADFEADLLNVYLQRDQPLTLTEHDVLINHVHAARRFSAFFTGFTR